MTVVFSDFINKSRSQLVREISLEKNLRGKSNETVGETKLDFFSRVINYRSNTIRVSRAVYKEMQLANRARDQKQWEDAAQHFLKAIDINPNFPHIWIQLGHVYTNLSRFPEAINAYVEAICLEPATGEASLHAGAWCRKTGDIDRAFSFYKIALLCNDSVNEAIYAIKDMLPSFSAILDRSFSRSIDDNSPFNTNCIPDFSENSSSTFGQSYAFDVSDLIAHYKNSKFPTGIQRVQIEVVLNTIKEKNAGIFFFVDGRDDFIYISQKLFQDLAEVSTSGTIEEWEKLKSDFFAYVLFAPSFEFQKEQIVINLGTSWWIYNYFLKIRNLKNTLNIKFISYVHDLIPVLRPEHCVSGVTIDYISWLVGSYEHSDGFITNSKSTTRDLLYVMGFIGRSLTEDRVHTVPLNAPFSNGAPTDSSLEEKNISKWDLSSGSYVLFVSTIESRKNHEFAFKLWLELYKNIGPDYIPDLVCIGKNGWLNQKAYDVIALNPFLSKKIKIIEKVSDIELSSLYACCLFTFYPSHYEGWGLPISESLSFGKVPVYADNSSLVEAGQGLGISYESNNIFDALENITSLIQSKDKIKNLEYEISRYFYSASWHTIAHDILKFSCDVSKIENFPKIDSPHPLGCYVPMRLQRSNKIWPSIGSGEIYRVGDNWLWPHDSYCQMKPGVSRLCIREVRCRIARLFIHFRGLNNKISSFIIKHNSSIVFSGKINPSSSMWSVFDINVGSPHLEIDIECFDSEIIEMNYGGSTKEMSGSISTYGFLVSDAENPDDRLDFLFSIINGKINNKPLYEEEKN